MSHPKTQLQPPRPELIEKKSAEDSASSVNGSIEHTEHANVTPPSTHKVKWYRSTLYNAIILGLCNFLAPGLVSFCVSLSNCNTNAESDLQWGVSLAASA